MENTTRLTWAIPVEAHILGASLEAYVESKAAITTFKLCAKYGNPSVTPLSTLPAELLSLVAGYIERSCLDEHSQEWKEAFNCMEHHYDCELCESLDEEDDSGRDEHSTVVASHVEKISNKRPVTASGWRFKRCCKIFAQEFNLEIYFDFFRSWNHEDADYEFPGQVALGYLTLPTAVSKIKLCEGPGVVSYLASTIIDPSILRLRSAEEKARFTIAMRRLHLAPHPHKLPVTRRPSSPKKSLRSRTKTENTSANTNATIPHNTQNTNTHDRQNVESSDPVAKNKTRSKPAAPKTKKWPQLMILSSGSLDAGINGH